MKRPLKILYVASEVYPYSKSGGLADFSASLPEALASFDHDIRVVTPRYRDVDEEFMSQMTTVAEFTVQLEWRKQPAIIKKIDSPVKVTEESINYPIYFIENAYYFDRSGLYNHFDDAERFAFFCKAVLEMLPHIGFQPDIIHCNDWQTAPICMLLKEHYRVLNCNEWQTAPICTVLKEQNSENVFYHGIKTLFTIHNIQYQGNFPKSVLNLLGFDEQYFRYDSIEFYGHVNFIKAGLIYSDLLSTVSKTYAKEIQTSQGGGGLEGVLQKRALDLYGITNGIDYQINNPKTNPYIPYHYDVNELEGKKQNRDYLLQKLNLKNDDVMVVSMITRIVEQKGFQLIRQSIHDLIRKNIVLIIMGSGDPMYEEMLRNVEKQYPDQVRIIFGYEVELAHQIYAGSDVCLMPSYLEPSGLTQLISMRYGTIPIVRKIGGLADTVKEFQPTAPDGNGFVFEKFESGEMLKAVEKAKSYFKNSVIWKRIIENSMNSDYSWKQSAKQYEALYEKLI